MLGDYGCFELCFRENCLVMKITFFAIFDPTWTYILASKGSNIELLKQYFNFQSIRKTKAIFLGLTCAKKGTAWPTPKMQSSFFCRNNKADHKLSKTFYFIKISYVLTELWIFLLSSKNSGVFGASFRFPFVNYVRNIWAANNTRIYFWHYEKYVIKTSLK